eukprot:Stramenopile-MAST_4_protein_5802
MPLYALVSTTCSPPTRNVTTDTSLVQLVTPADGPSDVLYALRYEPDKLWVQCSQAPPSDAERTQLNRARKDVLTNSEGVYTTCPKDFTSELRALYPSAAHKPASQWHDARVELKALKKRVPLLEKAKYNFKPLENAVDGLECTHRLREETRGMSGLPFHANHVEALRSQLPALIAVGDADKRKAVLKRLIDLGLTDEISRANASPYTGSKKTANRALVKQYTARIDLLERFYTQFAEERNLPTETAIRLRRILCADDVQNPFRSIERKCQLNKRLHREMKRVMPKQLHDVSMGPIKALEEQDFPGHYKDGLYNGLTAFWAHLVSRRALEYAKGSRPNLEKELMGELDFLKQTAKDADDLSSVHAKGTIAVHPLPRHENSHAKGIGSGYQPTPFTDAFSK